MSKKKCICQNCDCGNKEHPINKYEKPLTDSEVASMSIEDKYSTAVGMLHAHHEGTIKCPECESKVLLSMQMFSIDGLSVSVYFTCKNCKHIFAEVEGDFMRKYYDLAHNLRKLTNGMYSATIREGTMDNEGEIIGQLVCPSNQRKYIWNMFAQVQIYPPIPYTIDISMIEYNEGNAEKGV